MRRLNAVKKASVYEPLTVPRRKLNNCAGVFRLGTMVIKVRRLREEPGEFEQEIGADGVNFIDVVLKRDLAAFSSRLLRIKPEGHTAYHSHGREHVVVVSSGVVRVKVAEESVTVQEAHVVAIPPNTLHQFINPGPGPLALLVLNLFPESAVLPPVAQAQAEIPPENPPAEPAQPSDSGDTPKE
jgi:mannose-6-phosphate isomerase-like protein (cupin superfamily)